MITDASASDKSVNFVEKPVILIVDDSRVIRLALKKMLQKEYTLIEAENGEAAWNLLMDNESIQMVFSDLSMPGLDGFGLLERIRNSELERMNTIPFIAISGNEDSEKILQRVRDCGATDLITKPFQSKDIKDRASTYTRHLSDAEMHSSSEPSILDDITGSVDNLSSIDQMLKEREQRIIQPVIKTEDSSVTNLIPNDGRQRNEEDPASRPVESFTQNNQSELDKQNSHEKIRGFLHSSFEDEASRRIKDNENDDIPTEERSEVEHNAILENKAEETEGNKEENESCASKEDSEKSYLERKIDEHAHQQEVLELIQHENELETVVAFDVQQRIHGNYRDDQGNKEETEIIRLEIEKKLANEREQKLASCSSFTRFIVTMLERINTLRWVNLDNKIKNILKRSVR